VHPFRPDRSGTSSGYSYHHRHDRGRPSGRAPWGTTSNRQWRLESRPTGEPTAENFELTEEPIPEPGPKEVLVRTEYLSVDPYMRGRMRDSESYADPWPVGEPMRARAVGTVVESNHAAFEAGDTVSGNLYWAEYAAVDGTALEPVDTGTAPSSTALHVLGMPGRTAYVGTVDIGGVEPGDTVVVSAAAGAVGSVAGQIARIAGCRVVGITGRDEKADWLTGDLAVRRGDQLPNDRRPFGGGRRGLPARRRPLLRERRRRGNRCRHGPPRRSLSSGRLREDCPLQRGSGRRPAVRATALPPADPHAR